MATRILCIDDDPGTNELVRAHLESLGYEVTAVLDGESGLAESYIHPYDVILIDHLLPNMSGIEIIQKLHESNDFPPATIMVTGTGDEHIAVEAMRAGADDYVTKDVSGQYLHLLAEVIAQVLEKQDLRHRQHQMLQDQSQLIQELQSFNYAVAHDLKQPLSVLSTSLELLERYLHNQDAAKADNKLNQMRHTVSKMDQTLDALIMFARARESEEVECTSVDMHQLVHNVKDQLIYMLNQHRATVTIQDDIPHAYGHAPWIESIWINYLTNAIKYGGVPPSIEIGGVRQSDDTVYYWVKDNGNGLTPQQQEKIFLPFSRLQERKAEGHGLGLAIVRLIARRMGGEATVNSFPGRGSTFGFILMSGEK